MFLELPQLLRRELPGASSLGQPQHSCSGVGGPWCLSGALFRNSWTLPSPHCEHRDRAWGGLASAGGKARDLNAAVFTGSSPRGGVCDARVCMCVCTPGGRQDRPPAPLRIQVQVSPALRPGGWLSAGGLGSPSLYVLVSPASPAPCVPGPLGSLSVGQDTAGRTLAEPALPSPPGTAQS